MVLNRVNANTRGIGKASSSTPFTNKRIQAGLSTQIVIQVEDEGDGNKYTIGAIQSLSITESRSIETIKEVGTDANVGIVPVSPTSYTASLNRIVFDFQRLPQALQREYRHINSQRRAFDIVITDYNPYIQGPNGPAASADDSGGGSTDITDEGAVTEGATTFSTRLKNCWFNNLRIEFSSSNFMITESAEITFQAIWDEGDGKEVQTYADPKDSLERKTNASPTGSIMSAASAIRNP